MSDSIEPVEAPVETPDIPSPGRPPPPPPPDLGPLDPVTERPPPMPKRTPDSRHRPPFPSYPDDAPELIRNATAGIRGGSAQASRGHSLEVYRGGYLDWPGRR